MRDNPRPAASAANPEPVPDDGELRLPQHGHEPVVLRLAPGDAGPSSTEEAEDLTVFVGRSEPGIEGRLPVAGRYERDGDALRFTPAFGFTAEQRYVVRTRSPGGPHRLTEFTLPEASAAPSARVTRVYPSADILPENVLRFYVHFSVPMAPHRAPEFVQLRDTSGVADQAAFMKFKQELWNEDRTRLTILVDPGRIKRSVATRLDLGPAMEEGRRYTLTVNEGWPSADGASSLPAYCKHFRVGPPMRRRPDAALWKSTVPRPGTREPLTVRFDRSFDRHLLSTALHVTDNDGRAIAGSSHVGDHEVSWSFTPHKPWAVSGARIVIDEGLEDVAGNNFRGLLDQHVRAAARTV